MTVSSDVLRLHLDYTAWASRRLLDVVAGLSPEELTHDFKTSDRNILNTLAHVFAADRVWLSRIHGSPRATFIDPEDRELPALQQEWPVVLENWKTWAAPMRDEDMAQRLSYTDLRGNRHEQPLWQIVLHVVNHGTHHRGQASGFLRALGYAPPPLDLIAYYRGL